jgi:Tfp pilus assembly protein PilO
VTKKKLPQSAQIAIAVAALLLVAAVGYFALVKPQKGKAASLSSQIADQDKQIVEARALLAKAKNAQKVRVADLFRLTKAMPDQPDEAGIVLELTSVARQSGIDFESIAPSASTPLSGYQVIPITVIFDGNFFQLTDFLFRLRNLVDVRRGRSLPTVASSPSTSVQFGQGEAKFPQVKATLTIDAYIYGTARRERAAADPDAGDVGNFGHDVHSTTDHAFRNDHDSDHHDPVGDRGNGLDRGDQLMAKKKFDPKAKAKRQKVMLAVGSVLLLGLLAFQVPRTMKMMKSPTASSSSSPPTTTTSTTAGSTPLAPPSLDGSSTAATGAATAVSTASQSTDGVSDPSNPLPPNSGQLVSFSKFKSKDPFHQQISDCGGDSTPTGPSACGSNAASAAPKAVSAQKPSSGSTPSASLFTGGSKTPAAKAHAGDDLRQRRREQRQRRALIPGCRTGVYARPPSRAAPRRSGSPGGSYENGAATISVKKGQAVTLMNTADGTRYVLRFVSAA